MCVCVCVGRLDAGDTNSDVCFSFHVLIPCFNDPCFFLLFDCSAVALGCTFFLRYLLRILSETLLIGDLKRFRNFTSRINRDVDLI